jgi:hypothetical protein
MKRWSKELYGNCYIWSLLLWLRNPFKRRIVIIWWEDCYPHTHVFTGDRYLDFTPALVALDRRRRCCGPTIVRGRIRVLRSLRGSRCVYNLWPFRVYRRDISRRDPS